MKKASMTIPKRSLLPMLFLMMFLNKSSECQTSSFQLGLEPGGYFLEDVLTSENGEIMALIRDTVLSSEKKFYLVPVPLQGGVVEAQTLKFPLHATTYSGADFNGESFCFTYRLSQLQPYMNVLTCVNLGTGTHWTKKIVGIGSRDVGFTFDSDGNLIVVNGVRDINSPYFDSTKVVELFKLDTLGNTIWQKGLVFKDVPDGAGVSIKSVRQGSTGEYYVHGLLWDNYVVGRGITFLLKLDYMGNPLLWKTIEGHHFNEMIVAKDGVLLFDQPSFLPALYGGTVDKKQAKLVKFDLDLDFLWAKKYQADSFRYFSASVKELPNGHLLMSHVAVGVFPTVVTEMDTNGNILNQKGFPNYQPIISILPDGSFLMTSIHSFNETGELTDKIIFAKTDSEGNITGCPVYPTCVYSDTLGISFGTFSINPLQFVYDLDTTNIDVEQTKFIFSPFCDYPPAPIPDFNFPDTICLGGCAKATDTYNWLAQSRSWHLLGPGIDTMVADSILFSFCFFVPGEYLLKQTIVLMGCAYDFEKNITVLPSLEVVIGPSVVCPNSPQTIRASANRDAMFVWENGLTGDVRPVFTSNTFSVSASDGHCLAVDTATIQVVTEPSNAEEAFSLPPDTSICRNGLPFLLSPTSDFVHVFFIETKSDTLARLLLEDEGSFNIGAIFSGCIFWDTFQLNIEDCKIPIYLPNVFSPNGDGINDIFLPLGQDFEVLELQTFDRWGGLLHVGTAWDGGNAGQGTYTFKLVYKNLKTGGVEVTHGEVILVR